MRSIFDPILPTTEKSERNVEIEANRPKNAWYKISDKGRFLTRQELMEGKKWSDLGYKSGDKIDGLEAHAREVDITRK